MQDQHNSVARFLEGRGLVAEALQVRSQLFVMRYHYLLIPCH